MNLDSEIIVVSGLPRSGTSLMMQMLDAAGVEIVTDHIRSADVDNPRGYLEFERAKQVQKDTSWLPHARDKAFKMVSQLLYHLPPTERYRIIFMQRKLEEVLISQEKMLRRRNGTPAPYDEMEASYRLHLETLFAWLSRQTNMRLLPINYNDLVENPHPNAERIRQFLGGGPSAQAMAAAVDRTLYRNRSTSEV